MWPAAMCDLINLIHTNLVLGEMKMFRWCGLELVYIPTHTLIRSFPISFSKAPLCLMCLLIFSQNTVGQFSISSMVNASVCSGPAVNTQSRGFQRSFLLREIWVQSDGIPKSLCLHVILSNKIYLAFRLLGFFPCVFWLSESPTAFWVGNASNSKWTFLWGFSPLYCESWNIQTLVKKVSFAIKF